MIDAFQLRFTPPEQLSRDLKVDDSAKAVMAMTSGKFSSAFPNGQPAKENKNPNAHETAPKSVN